MAVGLQPIRPALTPAPPPTHSRLPPAEPELSRAAAAAGSSLTAQQQAAAAAAPRGIPFPAAARALQAAVQRVLGQQSERVMVSPRRLPPWRLLPTVCRDYGARHGCYSPPSAACQPAGCAECARAGREYIGL